jgi:hypothetical protein
VTRFGGTRALTAVLIALLVPIGTAQRATALDPPNEAPDIVLPTDGDTDEDSPYNFVDDAITLTDADAGTDDVRLDLSVTSGVLHIADTTGLTFMDGTTNDSDTLAMTGSLSAFDAALDLLQLMPDQDDTATVTLTATADDLGHNGDGGPQTDTDTMDITVNPVNDAPVLTVPGTQSIAANTVATLSVATSNAVSVSDVDANGNDVKLTLTGTSGTVTLATTAGLSFSAGDGTADATMTFTGTLAALNTALDGMTFKPTANFAGAANLSVDADDQGNTGVGGSATDHEDVTINVSPAPAPPRLGLTAGTVAVSPVGHLTVPVTCAAAACNGTLELRSGGSALGSGAISVAPGASGTVAIDLTAAGRALVSSRPSVDVLAVMTVTGASTTARALTLTAARASAVKLPTGKAHVRAGKAKVKLSCGSSGPCSVSYVLTATIGSHAKTLATAHVDLAAGATKTLKLKLAKAVTKALRKGAVAATQTATSDIAVGIDSTTTASLKLVT